MSIYKYYSNEFKGLLNEGIVVSYETQAKDIIDMYVRSRCFDKSKSLEGYGDFNKALCYQIELLHQVGASAINGTSGENDISSIKTDNYEIQVSASRRNQYMWKGLPFHVMAKIMIDNELRKNGYLYLGVNS